MAPSDATQAAAAGVTAGLGRSASQQGLNQILGLLMTLAFALIGGALTGLLIKLQIFLPSGKGSDNSRWNAIGYSLRRRKRQGLRSSEAYTAALRKLVRGRERPPLPPKDGDAPPSLRGADGKTLGTDSSEAASKIIINISGSLVGGGNTGQGESQGIPYPDAGPYEGASASVYESDNGPDSKL
ncbi:unnamed protein product [Sphagnum tenellum]